MQQIKEIDGKIVYVDKSKVLLAKGNNLFISPSINSAFELWATLDRPIYNRILSSYPLLARLFRLGIHHLLLDQDTAVALMDKTAFACSETRSWSIGPIVGSKPMVTCAVNGAFYYGEYRSNKERSPVHIWRWSPHSGKWVALWKFDNVRHIHGIHYDSFAGCFWVTTGDEDSESAIWQADSEFKSVTKVIGGTQLSRAVQLLFSSEFVYFGSDAPGQTNYIFRFNRRSYQVDKLVEVASSVFYGCQVGDKLFFSTAAEPSEVNAANKVEIWCSDNGQRWQKCLELKKDHWSLKYFLYGQATFPSGEGDGRYLYLSPLATEFHGKTLVYKLD